MLATCEFVGDVDGAGIPSPAPAHTALHRTPVPTPVSRGGPCYY